MMNHCCDVLNVLQGKTLVTAESCTGGGIGAALTDIPGSSAVYKGGIIAYSNQVKMNMLHVLPETLETFGAVSAVVARQMAENVRDCFNADVAVSVTGLAGPDGDDFGNPVGTVYVGYCDKNRSVCEKYCFSGDRAAVRKQTIFAALELILKYNKKEPV